MHRQLGYNKNDDVCHRQIRAQKVWKLVWGRRLSNLWLICIKTRAPIKTRRKSSQRNMFEMCIFGVNLLFCQMGIWIKEGVMCCFWNTKTCDNFTQNRTLISFLGILWIRAFAHKFPINDYPFEGLEFQKFNNDSHKFKIGNGQLNEVESSYCANISGWSQKQEWEMSDKWSWTNKL